MGGKKTLIATLLGAYSVLLSYSAVWAWQTNINGTANSTDWANAVAVDAVGNVIAAGSTQNTDSGQKFTVVKFDKATGAELWRRVLNGTANDHDFAAAVAVDAMGDVVAAGYTEDGGESSRFTVVKLNGATGAELWYQLFDGDAVGWGLAYQVAVDHTNNVIAAGTTHNSETGYIYFTVVKYDGVSGVELWRSVINGTVNGDGQAWALAVDGVGNVVTGGYTNGNCTDIQCMDRVSDFTIVKFDGVSGAEVWRKEINGTVKGPSFAHAIAVDFSGDVVAAGATTNAGTSNDFTVAKLDGANGAELWRRIINGSANDRDSVNAVTLDAAGNIVGVGYIGNVESGQDFIAVKLDAVGTELWRRIISGTDNGYDSANAVALDSSGDVVAAGMGGNIGPSDAFAVIKLAGTSGAELGRWLSESAGMAQAVVLDAAGNVVAAGTTSHDFTVVKFNGTELPPPPPAPLVISATTLATGEAGVSFTSDLLITGGVAPYVVSITRGKLPAGLSLGNDGIISGILSPTASTEKVTVRITDSVNESITQSFTITVLKALRVAGRLRAGSVGNNYSASLKTRGGLGPFNWNITAGAVPGLSLNSATGALTGIPTQAGEFPLTVQVTDSLGGVDVENVTLKVR